MPFVKLDCGILDSSLWPETEQRNLFITALLMAEPREFDEPIQQIHADRIEPTGFVAPPGWYGFIGAAGSGIVRRAGLGRVEGMAALIALGEPDEESRSKEHDGRRMIRIDGGYLVLNYQRYRDIDYGSADRSRRWREKKKQEAEARRENSPKGDTRDDTSRTRDDTQAEGEAEAEGKNPSVSGSVQPELLPPAASGKPKPPTTKSKSSQAMSDEEFMASLQSNPAYAGIDLVKERQKMHAWCSANNCQPTRKRFVNWINRADKPLQKKGDDGIYNKF